MADKEPSMTPTSHSTWRAQLSLSASARDKWNRFHISGVLDLPAIPKHRNQAGIRAIVPLNTKNLKLLLYCKHPQEEKPKNSVFVNNQSKLWGSKTAFCLRVGKEDYPTLQENLREV